MTQNLPKELKRHMLLFSTDDDSQDFDDCGEGVDSVDNNRDVSASPQLPDEPGSESQSQFNMKPVSTLSPDDIGCLYLGDLLQRDLIATLSDDDKKHLLCEHWMPPVDFQWPHYQKKTQKVFLRANHISGPRYGCFKFSRELQG
jgi:hypothetical protein